MRIATLLALIAGAFLLTSATPEPACAACSSFPCTVSSKCSVGCSCMKSGADTYGTCVSFD